MRSVSIFEDDESTHQLSAEYATVLLELDDRIADLGYETRKDVVHTCLIDSIRTTRNGIPYTVDEIREALCEQRIFANCLVYRSMETGEINGGEFMPVDLHKNGIGSTHDFCEAAKQDNKWGALAECTMDNGIRLAGKRKEFAASFNLSARMIAQEIFI